MSAANAPGDEGGQRTRLLVTRHGETLWNRQGLIQGHQAVALSELGRAQAAELRERLREYDLAVAYASDLVRTAETATIALRGRDVPLHLSAGLRECHYGEWEGLSSYIEERGEGDDGQKPIRRARVGGQSSVPHPNAAPGGETLTMVLERFLGTVEKIAHDHGGQTVLLVSHDGPIRAWFSQILGWDLARCWEIEIRHCGLSEVDYTDGQPRLVRIDGTVNGKAWNGAE